MESNGTFFPPADVWFTWDKEEEEEEVKIHSIYISNRLLNKKSILISIKQGACENWVTVIWLHERFFFVCGFALNGWGYWLYHVDEIRWRNALDIKKEILRMAHFVAVVALRYIMRRLGLDWAEIMWSGCSGETRRDNINYQALRFMCEEDNVTLED